jgi:hypothetical protein
LPPFPPLPLVPPLFEPVLGLGEVLPGFEELVPGLVEPCDGDVVEPEVLVPVGVEPEDLLPVEVGRVPLELGKLGSVVGAIVLLLTAPPPSAVPALLGEVVPRWVVVLVVVLLFVVVAFAAGATFGVLLPMVPVDATGTEPLNPAPPAVPPPATGRSDGVAPALWIMSPPTTAPKARTAPTATPPSARRACESCASDW